MWTKSQSKNGLTFALMSGAALSAIAVSQASAQSIADVVVVTSQRTEQSLQDVPIAVSAFGGEELDSRQIESFSDIQFNIPNFSFSRNNFTTASISLRGIGALAVASSSEPAVSVHMNDVFLAAPRIFETEFFDVERVEIVRGPQGTLFGRNATAGVLNVITNKANTDEIGGSIDAEFGSFQSVKVKGAINVPLSDALAVRLAGTIIQRDGYVENQFTGNDIDDRDIHALRGSVRWLPTDNTTIDFTASYFKEEDMRQRASSSSLCNPDPAIGCAPGPLEFGGPGPDQRTSFLAPTSFETIALLGQQGGLPPDLAAANAQALGLFSISQPVFNDVPQSTDPRVVSLDLDPQNDVEESIFMVNAKHDFDYFTVKVNAGLGNSKIANIQDFDGGSGFALNANPAMASGVPANALFPGSVAFGGTPILANTLFAGGTLPVSSFDFEGLVGAIGGNELVRSNRYQSANISIGETDYWSLEAIVNTEFDGRFNFLFGANYSESNGFANFAVTSSTLDYFAATGAVTGARGTAYNQGFSAALAADPTVQGFSTFSGIPVDTINSIFSGVAGAAGTTILGVPDFAAFQAAAPALVPTDPAQLAAFQAAFDNIGAANRLAAVNAGLTAANTVDGVSAYVPFFYNDSADTFTDSLSFFGEVYVDITDRLKFTGGVRRNFDDKGVRNRGNFLESILVPGAAVPFVPVGTQTVRPLLDSDEETEGTAGALNDFVVENGDFNATTGRAVIEYAWTDNVNVYASYSRGFKAGGFNPRASQSFGENAISNIYDPENINAFEIGVKSNLFANMLQANLTAFYYDYSGLQIANFRAQTTLNENVDATIWGVEGEFVLRPTDDLIFNSTLSYLNTEIGEFATINGADPTAGRADAQALADITNATNCVLVSNGAPIDLIGFDFTAVNPALGGLNGFTDDVFTVCSSLSALLTEGATSTGGANLFGGANLNQVLSSVAGTAINYEVVPFGLEQDVTGNELPGSPEFSISAGAQYTFRFGNGLTVTPRMDAYYQTRSFAQIFNAPQDRIDDYVVANAQVTIAPEEGAWFVRGFVQNITDNDAVTGISNFGQTAGNFYSAFLIEPRRYGASVGFQF